MYNFSGIKPEAIELLSLNRFNDSKAFYEEHKEEIKQGVTVPMRQIVLDLSDLVSDLDSLMDTNPVYVVSRIRRDTRRTKSKMLYRENLWLMLRRNKFQYPFAPFYWFEFAPDFYGYGLGFWAGRPIQLDEVRKLIIKEPERWFNAVKATEAAGLSFNTKDFYKKDRIPSAPEDLKRYLNAKNFEFSAWKHDLSKIATTEIIDELRYMISVSSPMYEFLIEAYDNAFNEGLINADYYKR